tara:strand:- start:1054 stop:1221 length:168 start_codon:yes stop_codon:yes gene_type:complete
MDKGKLKLIVQNLKSLVELLESEVYSEPESYLEGQQNLPVEDYDEIWEDDDGYPD